MDIQNKGLLINSKHLEEKICALNQEHYKVQSKKTEYFYKLEDKRGKQLKLVEETHKMQQIDFLKTR